MDVFGCDMLDKQEMLPDFEALVGFARVKPFECVGTVEEVRCALEMTAQKYEAAGIPLPLLLKKYMENPKSGCEKTPAQLLSEWNTEHSVPKKFEKYTAEMFEYVSKIN